MNFKKILSGLGKALLLVVAIGAAVGALIWFATHTGDAVKADQGNAADYAIMDRYDTFMTNTLSDSLEGVLSIQKTYWLSDDDLVAPEPDQACFGETDDPATLGWLLEEAKPLLDGQETLFSTEVQIFKGSKVQYYLDDTILVITWKQVMDDSVYTLSEVRIAHPTQFRRFLADGVYASGSKYPVREMAEAVNAVVACNGDFYAFRDMGIIVYDSQLMRPDGFWMDTCFIDGKGDIRFVHAQEMTNKADMEAFVEQEGVRFSLAFGPILVEDGQIVPQPGTYPVGEGDGKNPRAALGQLSELHYLLVTVSAEPPYEYGHTLDTLAKNMQAMGCIQAYNLDGGQTATIVMNDKVVNYVYERQTSDIIYFATALPNGD